MIILSSITIFSTRYVRLRSKRLTARLAARLTEDRSLEFLSYLTKILSSGETVQLLDELMKYYTTVRVEEAERGADTVNVVMKRLETVIWELAQLLERATGIERVRYAEGKINSNSTLAFSLSWVLLFESSLTAVSSLFVKNNVFLYGSFASFGITLAFSIGYALMSYLRLNKMESEVRQINERSC